MRIISKFSDYYDGVQAYGQDQSLIYNRIKETRSFSSKDTNQLFSEDTYLYKEIYITDFDINTRNIGLINVETFYIGICGNIYPLVKLEYKTDTRSTAYPHKTTKFVNSEENLHLALQKIEGGTAKKLVNDWTSKNHDNIRWWLQNREGVSLKEQYTNFFKRPRFDKYWKFSVDHKIVCFSMRRVYKKMDINFEINPCLKGLGGPIVSNPFDTFQNIAMYLGGVLGNEAAPMITIEDKYRIESHGYDKWSFRKKPTKNK